MKRRHKARGAIGPKPYGLIHTRLSTSHRGTQAGGFDSKRQHFLTRGLSSGANCCNRCSKLVPKLSDARSNAIISHQSAREPTRTIADRTGIAIRDGRASASRGALSHRIAPGSKRRRIICPTRSTSIRLPHFRPHPAGVSRHGTLAGQVRAEGATAC